MTNEPQAKVSNVKTSTNNWISYVKKWGNEYRDTKKKNPREGSFGRPPRDEFGADAARSFADQTMGVGGTSVRSRRARWRSRSRRSSAGYSETSIVGRINLDVTTTTLLYDILRIMRAVSFRS